MAGKAIAPLARALHGFDALDLFRANPKFGQYELLITEHELACLHFCIDSCQCVPPRSTEGVWKGFLQSANHLSFRYRQQRLLLLDGGHGTARAGMSKSRDDQSFSCTIRRICIHMIVIPP